MKQFFRFLFFACTSFLVLSCSDNDDAINDNDLPTGAYINGTFVVNEGNFGAGNSAISFIDAEGNVSSSIFENVNGFGVGDVAQSMSFNEESAYIVVNNSNTIEVVNRYTFEHIATVSSQLNNPRYMAIYNDKGYVSNWGDPLDTEDDFIAVVDLSSNEVVNTISVSEGPEAVKEINGKLYVAHKGGYGYGNTISVVNLASGTVSNTIEVADVPHAMKEESGALYVICSGREEWTGEVTLGALVKIDLATDEVAQSLPFAEGVHPSNLDGSGNNLYYTIGAEVYQTTTSASALPSDPLFSVGEQGVYGIYGFAVANDKIYIGDAKEYNSNGDALVYSLDGTLLNTYAVGIAPNGFYFNN